jgi:hypothetical protein
VGLQCVICSMTPFWRLDIFRRLTDFLVKRAHPLLFSKCHSKCCIYSDRSRLTPVTKKKPHLILYIRAPILQSSVAVGGDGLEDHDLTNTIICVNVLRLGSLKNCQVFLLLAVPPHPFRSTTKLSNPFAPKPPAP